MEIYLNEMTVPLVVVGCLIVGYFIKNYLSFKIRNIPLILFGVGVLLNIWINGIGNIAEKIIHGGVSGLISTGLYEAFKNMIHKVEED